MNHQQKVAVYICRTCTTPSTLIHPIFGSPYNIDKILFNIFQIHVTFNDSLPQFVCDTCFRELITTAMIQRKFKAAESKLTNFVESQKVTAPKEVETIVIDEDEEGNTSEVAVTIPVLPKISKVVSLANGKKVFSCDLCHKKFDKKSSLTQHKKRTCKIGLTFQCDVCKINFKIYSKLVSHKADVHWNHFPYECKVCDSRFKKQQGLKTHFLEAHNKH